MKIIEPESKSLHKPLTPEILSYVSQKKASNLKKDKNKNSERKDSEAAFKLSGNIDKGNLRSSLLEFVALKTFFLL